ncbi:MAG: host attachment protein [Maritimibacter sp.]|jgi:protein required for attachment to host cells
MKPITTLVLLADDEKARLCKNLGPYKGLEEIEDYSAAVLEHDRFVDSDRAGRNQASPGTGYHAYDPEPNDEQKARAAFAELLIYELTVQFSQGDYDRLVVIAPPAMLGELRKAMPKKMKKLLVLDMPHDYLQLTLEEVVEALEGEIVI